MKYQHADDGLPASRCSCSPDPCHSHCDEPYVESATRPHSVPGVEPFNDRGSQFPGSMTLGLALWSHSNSGHVEMGVGLGPYSLGHGAVFIPHGQLSMVIDLLETARDELETVNGRSEVTALKQSRGERLAALRKWRRTRSAKQADR